MTNECSACKSETHEDELDHFSRDGYGPPALY
jgi:hypothetical protein